MAVESLRVDGNNAPAYQAAAISPSDSTDFTTGQNARAIYVGVSGDVVLIPAGSQADTSVTFKSVPVGILPVAARRVLLTGTTATDMVRLW